MDKLQRIALSYKSMLQTQYYFEISKKLNLQKFILSFEQSDFYHLAGLHKLKDIELLQTGTRKSDLFEQIASGKISLEQIKKSNFYNGIESRIFYLEKFQELIDQNQSIFRYIDKNNKTSLIKADYLLENVSIPDILFIFLSERKREITQDIPNMCCRSFFPMDKIDYSINQPAYTLLKKMKIDKNTGKTTVLYDRSIIIEKSQRAVSEIERKSVLKQLNEKKAQVAINEVLAERRLAQKGKIEPKHDRF